MKIYRNFWTEHPDNTCYKVLYMVYEALRGLNPNDWFLMPKIHLKLEQCSTDNSSYIYFGKGNGNKSVRY